MDCLDEFDLNAWRWTPADNALLERVEGKALKKKLDTQFLPAMSFRLARRLVSLPGKAWLVYQVLTYRCRLEKTDTVALTSTFLSLFGISRHEKARALWALEEAGLIVVNRRSRANPIVKVLPLDDMSSGVKPRIE